MAAADPAQVTQVLEQCFRALPNGPSNARYLYTAAQREADFVHWCNIILPDAGDVTEGTRFHLSHQKTMDPPEANDEATLKAVLKNAIKALATKGGNCHQCGCVAFKHLYEAGFAPLQLCEVGYGSDFSHVFVRVGDPGAADTADQLIMDLWAQFNGRPGVYLASEMTARFAELMQPDASLKMKTRSLLLVTEEGSVRKSQDLTRGYASPIALPDYTQQRTGPPMEKDADIIPDRRRNPYIVQVVEEAFKTSDARAHLQNLRHIPEIEALFTVGVELPARRSDGTSGGRDGAFEQRKPWSEEFPASSEEAYPAVAKMLRDIFVKRKEDFEAWAQTMMEHK